MGHRAAAGRHVRQCHVSECPPSHFPEYLHRNRRDSTGTTRGAAESNTKSSNTSGACSSRAANNPVPTSWHRGKGQARISRCEPKLNALEKRRKGEEKGGGEGGRRRKESPGSNHFLATQFVYAPLTTPQFCFKPPTAPTSVQATSWRPNFFVS